MRRQWRRRGELGVERLRAGVAGAAGEEEEARVLVEARRWGAAAAMAITAYAVGLGMPAPPPSPWTVAAEEAVDEGGRIVAAGGAGGAGLLGVPFGRRTTRANAALETQAAAFVPRVGAAAAAAAMARRHGRLTGLTGRAGVCVEGGGAAAPSCECAEFRSCWRLVRSINIEIEGARFILARISSSEPKNAPLRLFMSGVRAHVFSLLGSLFVGPPWAVWR